MSSKPKCLISFQMKVETPLTNQVYMSGDIPELGLWDPDKSLRLASSEDKHPIWTSVSPIELELGTKFQFKCVVMNGPRLDHWEVLPNDLNRRYRAKYKQVTLKGTISSVDGSEIVERNEFHSGVKKKNNPDKLPAFEKKQEKHISIEFDDKTVVKKRKLDGQFNPFSFADSGSEESDIEEKSESFSSSFISLERQDSREVIADKISKQNAGNKAFDNKIDEITSPKTPFTMEDDSKETKIEQPPLKGLKKTQNFPNFGADEKENKPKKLHLHEIFQQIKEKLKKNSNSSQPIDHPHECPYEDLPNDDSEKFLDKTEEIIIVSRFLPITVKKTENGWNVSERSEIFLINLMSFLFTEVRDHYPNARFVGWLRDDIATEDREDLRVFLLTNYRCLPIFFSSKQLKALSDLHMHDEITIIDMVTHNYYAGKESLSTAWGKRSIYWETWVTLNKDYADQILKIMTDQSLVVICEYNLILVPTYLMKEFSKALIAIYFNINFPGFESFRLIPYKEEILNGLLSSSIICFNDYSHVSEFFTMLGMLKGIEIENHYGRIFFKYMGRTIYVRMKTPSVEPARIEALQNSEDFEKKLNQIVDEFAHSTLILGVDPASALSGIEIKLNLFFKFVKETKNRYRLKLIQYFIKNPFSGFNSDSSNEFEKKIIDIAAKLNKEYKNLIDKEGFPRIHHDKLIEVKLHIDASDFLAQMTIAKIYLKTSIKSFYTLDVMSFVAANRNFGYALISEFIKINIKCSKILKFNPLIYSDFKDQINHILHMKHELSMAFHVCDINSLHKSSISIWLNGLLYALKRIGESIKMKKIATIEKTKNVLLTQKMILVNERYEFLPIEKVLQDYKKSQSRLILIDYEGTLVKYDYYTCITRTFKSYSDRFHMVSLKPEESLIKDILYLAQDPDNYLFIITGNKVEYLDHWFGHLINVGLAAEYGFFFKNKGTTRWGTLFTMDWSWKEIVKKIFENYKKNTEGSEVESKDSCIAWKYHEVQKDFGKKQSVALKKHLNSTLEYFKQIEIFQGNNYIEVRPKGINKGTMAEILMRKWVYERGKIDFILCMGDGLSDEEMFISIKNHLHERPQDFEENFEAYTCSIGKRPSQASYYLNNVEEVMNLLHLMKEIGS